MSGDGWCDRCGEPASIWMKHGERCLCVVCFEEVRDLEQAADTIARVMPYSPAANAVHWRLVEMAARRAVPRG